MQCAYGHEKQGRAVGLEKDWKICGKRGGRPLIMDLDVEALSPAANPSVERPKACPQPHLL